MAIAQHLVAGEVGLRPVPPRNVETPSPVGDDSVALSSDSVNLPWVILRAVHRASRLDGVPARARAVLAALARTVDASNPYDHIFARRELLTERAMQSERTFYRSLQDLEAAGLVERAQQRRYVQAGLFGRAYLHLTERAAIILGLVDAPATSAETNDAVAEDSAAPDPSEAFSHRSATLADGGIYKDLSPAAFQKRQPGQVPADLQRLRSLGFQKFLIFKLMREAREHGKRLSDVVEATWEHLKKATRPISYLRALLGSTADFGFQIRSRNAERDAVRAAVEEQQTAEALVAHVAGQSFVDTNGERKLVVDADGMSLSVYSVEEGVARREAGRWQVRFAKALRAGQIRVATGADIEAFAQARCRMSAPARTATEIPRVATKAVTDHLALLRGTLSRFAPAMARAV
jgi:DNA-binding transcriptional ArsR family regulator